jgi:hypothetical protein
VALVDSLTRALTRACLYLFWICILLALAFCSWVGIKACTG